MIESQEDKKSLKDEIKRLTDSNMNQIKVGIMFFKCFTDLYFSVFHDLN